MYNIEIYIDTCEDQVASTLDDRQDERSLKTNKDGTRRRLKHILGKWLSSSEDRYFHTIEYSNGR